MKLFWNLWGYGGLGIWFDLGGTMGEPVQVKAKIYCESDCYGMRRNMHHFKSRTENNWVKEATN